jgi:hypothetical protein
MMQPEQTTNQNETEHQLDETRRDLGEVAFRVTRLPSVDPDQIRQSYDVPQEHLGRPKKIAMAEADYTYSNPPDKTPQQPTNLTG